VGEYQTQPVVRGSASLATVHVGSGWARVDGVPLRCFLTALTFPHPQRFHNRAYRDGRWDGNVSVNKGLSFPAGLVGVVRDHLEEQRIEVRVVNEYQSARVDPDAITPGVLDGITLWDHQLRLARRCIRVRRGVIHAPTAAGKTAMMLAAARVFHDVHGWRSLIVEPKKGLAWQTVEQAARFYGGRMTVGLCGDSRRGYGDLTVGTAQTLIGFDARRHGSGTIPGDFKIREVIESADVLFLDECHHTSSDQWFTIAMACRAHRRYGVSATPFRHDDLSDARMIGATGPLVGHVEPAELMDAGLVTRPRIVVVRARGASEKEMEPVRGVYSPSYQDAYRRGVIESRAHNGAVVRAVEWMVDRGRRVLVLCRYRDHFQTLARMLDGEGLDCEGLWGDTPIVERDRVKARMAAGRLPVLLATGVMGEGEDLRGVSGIVLADGVKNASTALQRIGRGMRTGALSDGYLWVVDIVPVCHRTLRSHGESRVRAYAGSGYDVRVLTEWPEMGKGDDAGLLPFQEWD